MLAVKILVPAELSVPDPSFKDEKNEVQKTGDGESLLRSQGAWHDLGGWRSGLTIFRLGPSDGKGRGLTGPGSRGAIALAMHIRGSALAL